MNYLNNIQIVLCNTSHSGNIGAAARAMKTMGIYNLTLVSPLVMPDDHSRALSCNAHEVVENCVIAQTLDEAIASSNLVIALTGRRREFNHTLHTPKQIIPEIIAQLHQDAKISLVFGNEQNGLSIAQLEKCNRMVTIPGNPHYFSLNLAQAVQIMCYEIYSNLNSDISFLQAPVHLASLQDTQHIMIKLEHLIVQTAYNHGKNQERTLRRLQYILHKTRLEREDVDLLHGLLNKTMLKLRE